MTIPSQIRRAGPFVGNSSTTVFPFAFKVFAAEDVQVYLLDQTVDEFIETPLVQGVDYSIQVNPDQENNPGGDITYPLGGGAVLAPNQKLTAIGDLSYEQPTAITNQGGFYPRVIEDALDRCVIQIQQLAELMDRTLKAPVSGGESIADIISQLEEQLPMVAAVYAELAHLLTVSNNIGDVSATASDIGAVVTVAGDIGGAWETGVMYDFGAITQPPVGNTSPPGGNIVTVANNIDDIRTVAADLEGPDNVGTVAGSIANVDAVGVDIAKVITVADNLDGPDTIGIVAADLDGPDNVGTVAGSIANVDAVGGNIQDVTDVAANINGVDTIGTVAGSIANVDAVGTDITNVNAVAGSLQVVTDVAANINGVDTIGTVAGDIANVNAVSNDIANVNAVAADLLGDNTIGTVEQNLSDVIAVAGIKQDVQTVAGIEQDVQTVAGIEQDVQTVAAMEQDVQTVAWRQEEVHALGKDLTGQPLDLDYGSITDPVSNPASPTGVIGAVWSNEQNIADVAADIGSVVYLAQNMSAILDALAGGLRPSNNLSDLTDPAAARANLGLADLGTLT